ncbi:corticotropin-releasing factor receptor 2 isoform X2 [Choloepus didactylus]|uniref:corticotropin-releasing factor receptor 2 isoform X2 n=1 Tax=Choloepus didactylus TaxID=27675 RepID=UPI00189EB790|nr:corticotropin-releasing factor receptor 2 isoform X2 [Choloepus didactylus]
MHPLLTAPRADRGQHPLPNGPQWEDKQGMDGCPIAQLSKLSSRDINQLTSIAPPFVVWTEIKPRCGNSQSRIKKQIHTDTYPGISQNRLCPDVHPNLPIGSMTIVSYDKSHRGPCRSSRSLAWQCHFDPTLPIRARVLSFTPPPPTMCPLPRSACVSVCLSVQQRKYDLHYRIALIVNYLGHCISVATLVAAFLLFLALRSIRCLRNVIHWNLITTFILRNVMWFLLQLINHEVHESNEVWCRCITTIFNYFVVTNFFWMFMEGCYLHTAIAMTYSTERLRKWLFLFIGWCIPCPIIIAWAIGKLYYENEQCWFGKEPGDLVDYIYQGPIILVLLINFIFLFNIVRILMTKLRASTTSEMIQYRKAVKATLVLLPLLGITYMLFFVNPGEDNLSQIVFIYFNSFLQSFQGFFVSVFYCFFNGEVCLSPSSDPIPMPHRGLRASHHSTGIQMRS